MVYAVDEGSATVMVEAWGPPRQLQIRNARQTRQAVTDALAFRLGL